MRVFEESGFMAEDIAVHFGELGLFTSQQLCRTQARRDVLVKAADEALEEAYESLGACAYMRFRTDGDRTEYEMMYFKRRRKVFGLFLGCIAGEKEKYTNELIDGLWLLLEETSWILPAHLNADEQGDIYELPHEYSGKITYVDLFSAATGAFISVIAHYMQEELDDRCEVICKRINHELGRRIFSPFMEMGGMWWTGEGGLPVNNWNPWIVSNVLTAFAFSGSEPDGCKGLVHKAMRYLDNFTSGYAEDGGCDEGPSYWGEAAGAYFDCLELLRIISSGRIDVFGNPLVRSMGEYIMKVHVSDVHYLPFADAHNCVYPDWCMIRRFGERTGSAQLAAFGSWGMSAYGETRPGTHNSFRSLCNLAYEPVESVKYEPASSMCLNNLQIAAFRAGGSNGLYAALKGGHNNESHNHNDVGSFVVYSNGEPLLIDIGVGTYTRQTFSADRYSIFTMRSEYHNLPTIGGVMQCAGKKYASSEYYCDTESGTAAVEYGGAYPAEAGIIRAKRTLTVKDTTVTVTDEISLESKRDVSFTLMMCNKPVNTVRGELEVSGVKLRFGLDLNVEIQEIPLEDDMLAADWGRKSLYRVLLTARAVKNAVFTLRIE